MARVNAFKFEEGLHGLTLAAKTYELSAACLDESEVDFWIGAMKDDLDAIAAKMKARLSKRRLESAFDA